MLNLKSIQEKMEAGSDLTKEEVVFMFESVDPSVLDSDMSILRASVAEHEVKRSSHPQWYRNKDYREACIQNVTTIKQLIESRSLDEDKQMQLTQAGVAMVSGKTRALKIAQNLIESAKKSPVGKLVDGVLLSESCFAHVGDIDDPETWQCQIKNKEGKFVESNTICKVLPTVAADLQETVKNRYTSACANSAMDNGGRIQLHERMQLTESLHGSSDGRLSVTLIQPGLTKGRDKFYPREVLAASVGMYEGVKMYLDHPTVTEEYEQPERSVAKWVGIVESSRLGSGGEVLAEVILIDPDFKEKVELLESQGKLNTLELSQVAWGSGQYEKMEDGSEVMMISEINKVHSVDFITNGNAGGVVHMLESFSDNVEAISEDNLRLCRPDLIKLIENTFQSKRKESNMDFEKEIKGLQEGMKTLIESHKTETDTSDVKLEEANATIAGLKADATKGEAQEAIAVVVKESKLPEKTQTFLTESYAHITEFGDDAKKSLEGQIAAFVEVSEGAKVEGMGRTEEDLVEGEDAEDIEGKKLLRESHITSAMQKGMSKTDAEANADYVLAL